MATEKNGTLVDSYLGWIKENTEVEKVEPKTVKITLPFTNGNGEDISLYVTVKNLLRIEISDAHETVQYLVLSQKIHGWRGFVNRVCEENSVHADIEDEYISVETNLENFAVNFNSMIKTLMLLQNWRT